MPIILVHLVNQGGYVSILALNGLFNLITIHNLEYPQFYAKFYALFDENILHAKYMDRFFRKAELFLSSPYVPARVISSFVKKSARLTLNAPPVAIVTILSMFFNLFKVHSSCIKMIHKDSIDSIQSDPFDMSNLDPMKSEAIESSLWEIGLLQNHYSPIVVRMVKAFSESLAKPAFDTEEFLSQSYFSVN